MNNVQNTVLYSIYAVAIASLTSCHGWFKSTQATPQLDTVTLQTKPQGDKRILQLTLETHPSCFVRPAMKILYQIADQKNPREILMSLEEFGAPSPKVLSFKRISADDFLTGKNIQMQLSKTSSKYKPVVLYFCRNQESNRCGHLEPIPMYAYGPSVAYIYAAYPALLSETEVTFFSPKINGAKGVASLEIFLNAKAGALAATTKKNFIAMSETMNRLLSTEAPFSDKNILRLPVGLYENSTCAPDHKSQKNLRHESPVKTKRG